MLEALSVLYHSLYVLWNITLLLLIFSFEPNMPNSFLKFKHALGSLDESLMISVMFNNDD